MRKSFIFIFCLLFSVIVFASAASVLQKQLSSFHSMSANFSQMVLSSDGTVLQNSSGTMAIERPGKFRWITVSPMEQQIITDGKTVWVYDVALQQVVIRQLNQSIGQTPILLLTQNHIYLNKEFNIKSLPSKKGINQFQLTPKNQDQMFSRVILSFRNNQIDSMQFSNQLGQQTIVNFSHVRINPSIPANDFTFNIPKEADVVKQ